ncbi:hypothetical protein NQ317_012913 [Molorchus minor]|uniref:Uncharacterized protein n=1 Tax=Molorchus minor TaxID=1323400 RepID=A0ABQ9JBB5_9CUCU|nr:hypothetical protein NQ317_012913 [Molorchus minor]
MAVTMGSQLVFLSIFVTLTIGAPEYHLKDIQPRDIDGNVITYYFYSQSNLEEGIAIKSEKIHEISNTFDSDKETFSSYTDGWTDIHLYLLH